VLIRITDTGKGIPKNQLEHIFDRFHQVEDDNNSYHIGTGIGLALTRELVELHHGTIKVDSEPGKGSAFTILIPLDEEQLAVGSRQSTVGSRQSTVGSRQSTVSSSQQSETEPSTLNPEPHTQNLEPETLNLEPEPGIDQLILIVEDNEDMRFYIREYFEKEYHILEAVDGADGYEKAVEHIPDIIISDVMMPNMDGNEFCRKIKTDERTSHIPLILLTARASKESRIEGLETGADDFITKPFDGDELQVRVKNLIEQRKRIRKLLEGKIQKSPNLIKMDFADSGITSMDEQFLQKVITMVKERHTDPEFNTEAFSQAIGLGRVQLNRKIKAMTGQTTVSFIRTFRLNRAAEMIKKKSATVAEIAYDVGFNSPSYFTECFKEYFGKLPSEFNGNEEE